MKAVPVRYLPWMLRDLASSQGAVVLALGVLTWLIVGRVEPRPASTAGPTILLTALRQLSLLFLLFCSAAIVSNDRVHGYYRSFFSRPLSPAWYYFMRWLLGGLVFLLLQPVLSLALGLVIGHFPFSWTLLYQLAVGYLLLGGLIFFFSSFTRGDWLFGMLVLIVQSVLHSLRQGGVELGVIWSTVLTVLPPIYLASLNNPPPTGSDLLHILLYGGGLVIAALIILRIRPLGSGGRS